MATTHPRPTRRAHTPATRPRAHVHARARAHERRRRRWIGWAATAAVAVIAVTFVVVGGRTRPRAVTATGATAFRLASTSGASVSLGDFAGRSVLLYFNEGVGCDACFYQAAKLEADGGLAKSGVTLLPVVMNTAEQVKPELKRFGVRTPYLLDPAGTTSRAYDTLGTGHHADLPGHSFVLVGPDGDVRWRGDYPSMWVEPKELVDAIRPELP